MKEKQSSSISHIKDLKPDAKNARKHNPRNIGAIVDSLQAVGAGRSIVVDEHNTILAGNGVIEAATEAGITKLKIVEADGSTIIAVRRTGLTKKQKTLLALSDNRTNELSEWDGDNMRELLAGLDDSERIKLALAESDLKGIVNGESSPAASMEIHNQFLVMIECDDEAAQSKVLAECLRKEWSCKALTS
jgi:ParB-like chromosome segregation protein Spo0J